MINVFMKKKMETQMHGGESLMKEAEIEGDDL